MSCPHARLGPFDPDYLDDPYARFVSLRSTPVFYDEELDIFVVTRHAEVESVFRDPATFGAANAQDPITALGSEAAALLADAGFRKLKTMSNNDSERHGEIRRHTQVGFSPRRLRALEPVVRSTVASLLDDVASALAGGNEVDLVSALAFPLPATIVFSLLGFPPADTEMLKAWGSDRLAFSWGRPTAEEQVSIAQDMLAYWSYCEAHVQRRMTDPADDFTSDLIAIHRRDPESLSLDEIAHVIYGMSFAGHETTMNLISNTLRRVVQTPIWARVVDNPSVVASVVDEALRFDSSVISWRRYAREATTIGGVEIPEGGRLLLLLACANRDPDVFPDAETFDPGRQNSTRHLSFGFGRHYCLGATLAKLEVGVVLDELSRRWPHLRLVEQRLRFHPNISFRGPQELRVSAV